MALVTDAGDGSYDARYVVPKPGRYAVHVCCLQGTKQLPIRGSPFVVDCSTPWTDCAVQDPPALKKRSRGVHLVGWGAGAALVDLHSGGLWALQGGAAGASAAQGWAWRQGASSAHRRSAACALCVPPCHTIRTVAVQGSLPAMVDASVASVAGLPAGGCAVVGMEETTVSGQVYTLRPVRAGWLQKPLPSLSWFTAMIAPREDAGGAQWQCLAPAPHCTATPAPRAAAVLTALPGSPARLLMMGGEDSTGVLSDAWLATLHSEVCRNCLSVSIRLKHVDKLLMMSKLCMVNTATVSCLCTVHASLGRESSGGQWPWIQPSPRVCSHARARRQRQPKRGWSCCVAACARSRPLHRPCQLQKGPQIGTQAPHQHLWYVHECK